MPVQPENTTFSISQISRILEVHPGVLRRWETEFNLDIARDKKGVRQFSKKNLRELTAIQEKLNSKETIEKQIVKKPYYSIKEAAKILGVHQGVLRRWEDEFGLDITRGAQDKRQYSEQDIKSLRGIQNKLNTKANTATRKARKTLTKTLPTYKKQQRRIVAATTLASTLIFLLALQFNGAVKTKLQPWVLSSAKKKAQESLVETQRVLGARDRETNFVFNVNVPTNLGADVNIDGDVNITGNLFVPTINELAGIDLVTKTTLEEALELGGDFEGTLNNVTLAPGSVEGPSLADQLDYDGILNIEGVLQAAGDEGSDGQYLTSTGDGVEWIDPDDDADTLDSLDSTAFLRSNTSDSFTGGTLDFSDGTFLDLSSILHNDTTAQGLRLPQATTLTSPSTGEGYIAYDSDDNSVLYYNGTAWSSLNSSLQGAYDAGSTIQMTATNGDIQIYNDSSDQILFIDEDTARVGIGSTSPAYKLDVTGSVNISTGNDLYIEGEALRTAALGDRQYTADAFVIDSQTFTASIDALDQQVEDLTLGTAGLWTDTGSLIYLVDTTDDFVLGGTTLGNSIFSIDEDAGIFLFGGDNSVDPTLRFEATDASIGDFGFNANDAFHITNANLGVGTTNPGYALDVNGDFNANTLYIGGVLVSSTPAELNILDGATISTTELNLLNSRTGTLVDSNNVSAYATTAVDSGAGLTGGGGTGSLTVDVGAGSGISVSADAVALGALTSTWDQTGGFDIFLNNASSELRILESVGATYIGTFDVGDLSADRIYTFPDTEGTVLVDSSAPFELSGWDQDVSDDHTGTGSSGQISYWTGTYGQAGSDNLFWDNGNGSLGIGTSAPSSYLDIRGATTSRPSVSISAGSAPSSPSTGDIYADSDNIYWYNGSGWDDLTSGGAGLFTDGGATTYLSSLADNLAIGGSSPSSSVFAIEEGTGNFYFASDNSVSPTLYFEATDSDAGELGFNTNDVFFISGANLGIGTTNASSTLHITPTGAAAFQIDPYGAASGNTGETRFLELAANGSEYTGFKAPDSLASSLVYELPNAAGSADYVLTWQSGNALQWKEVTGVGGAGDITAVGSFGSGAAFADATADDDWLGLGASAARIEFDDLATDEVNILGANVGIGTTGPSAQLSVGASSQFRVSSTGDLTRINDVAYAWPSSQAAADNYVLTNDSAGNLTWESVVSLGGVDGTGTTNYIPLWSDSDSLSNSSIYETGGNVGIGTTNPSSLFTVGANEFQVNSSGHVGLGGASPATNTILTSTESFSVNSAVTSGYFSATNTNSGSSADAYGIQSYSLAYCSSGCDNYGGYFAANNWNANAGTVYGVYGEAYDGLTNYGGYFKGLASGGSDATYGLYAEGDAAGKSNSTVYGAYVKAHDNTGVNGTTYGIYSDTTVDWGTGYGLYVDAGTGAGTEYSGVFLNGNVGIGTTAPGVLLDVAGAGNFDSYVSADSMRIGAGSDAFLDIKAATTNDAQINLTSSSGTDVSVPVSGDFWWNGTNLYFYNGATNTDLLAGGGTFDGTGVSNYIAKFNDVDTLAASILYETGGNIGIGTTNPASNLEVVGTFTASTSVSTPLISLSGTGTLNGLDVVDSTTENTIEALIFDTDAENITGVWEVQDNTQFNFGDEADFTLMYDETTNDQFQISDGTNSFFTLSDQGSTAIARINGDDIYVESTGNVGIGTTDPTETLHVNGDIRIEGGELYFDPLSTSSSTTEGTVYYDDDVDHLYLYGGDSAFHRIALDMTKYTGTDSTVPNQSYVQIAHGQGTNDISVVGWFYDTVTSLWKKITQNDTTATKDLDNEFNPEHTQKTKTASVQLEYEETNLGNGADGAITVTADTIINNSNLILGRSCTDGGDAVNYNVSSLTSNTATLTSTPSAGCLNVGDEVLIINLQGTFTTWVNTGNWETLRIESISSNVITFTSDKDKYYGDGASDDTNLGTTTGTQRVMLQRVPNYTTVTVNNSINFYPDDWGASNGPKGGVMFFRATGAVAVNGTIHANSKGYAGGDLQGSGGTHRGGEGGEAFCGPGGQPNTSDGPGGNGASGAGGTNTGKGGDGYCGGGGSGNNATLGDGSDAVGGAGGGGGYAYGGGGGAGYGTYGGGGGTAGSDGGTNSSGDGANAYGGGGGGTYGDANLADLMFGSGAGKGGRNTAYGGFGGNGGDGGGIVYVAAGSITVSGTIQSHGGNGANQSADRAGGGGGGSGGSIKLIGNDLTLGTSKVTATGGTGGTGYTGSYIGGAGGVGRVAVEYGTSISGNSSPSYTSTSLDYNSYGIFVSNEIHTPGTTALNNIQWTEDLDTNGEIQIQTRSGTTIDSTDGTWEAWKPTTSSATLGTLDTHTDWSGTNATVSEGDILRNVDYFEDEDESIAGNLMKVTATAADGFAEDTIGATNITSYDYITFWVRSPSVGNIGKIGIGESAATEEEEEIYIDQANSWQKVYWDISDLDSSSCTGGNGCNAVTKLRFTVSASGDSIYFDNLKAESYLSTPAGSTVTSTANTYMQYRVILSTTNPLNTPEISEVEVNLTNASGSLDIDADRIRDPNEIGDIQSSRIIDPEKIDFAIYDTGDGADGAITVTTDTNINNSNLISGRTCSDGGDAVNYSVTALTSTTATLSSTPSAGCLGAGDEILLINLQGTNSAYGNTGNWETLEVAGVASNTITFTTSKSKYYGDGTDSDDTNIGTTTSTQRVMLQRVPNYTTVTVNGSTNFYPDDWGNSSGPVGGVIFFRATGAVSVNGTIHANSMGYDGGDLQGSGGTHRGGEGGEAFCGPGGLPNTTDGPGGNGASGAGGTNTGKGGDGYCGGGGSGNNATLGDGSDTVGGAGGGGGYAYGAGGAGGYGTYGTGGQTAGQDGGTDSSGDGGNAYGGGGGGTYGDANLVDLMFGSAGGKGGRHTSYGGFGGNGGDGGGIVYISADSVTVSGAIQSNGGNGANQSADRAGGGGGGAGGSVKIMGNDLTLGTGVVTASGGSGGSGYTGSYIGGTGGSGRIAVYYDNSGSGTTTPTYTFDTTSEEYKTYEVFTSKEIATTGATSFTNISWTEDLDTNGEIQFQTRSGNTINSTDGSWEAWKPTTSSTTLETANTHTNWTGTNTTVADGDVTRNINYYEDEDEGTAGNLTKLTSTAAGGFAEATISSTDITSYDYISFWIRSSIAGDTVDIGLGESAATEETESLYIDQADTWQKVYWDISDLDSSSCTGGNGCNAVTKLRFTISPNSTTVYIDNIKAESYLTTSGGSSITSTANNYIQYRAILSTTNVFNSPALSEVTITYNDGSSQTISDRTANQNDVDQYENELRLNISEYELDDYKSIRLSKGETSITMSGSFYPGSGSDGDVTITTDTNINTMDSITGRSCSDGGDAVSYNIVSLTSRTATLSSGVSDGCLTEGDEVLIINIQGTYTAFPNVGVYETLIVDSIAGETVTFKTAKIKYYGDNPTDDSNLGIAAGTQRVLLQRVPHYKNLTVEYGSNFFPADWDGTKGGVMFFRASGAVAIDGTIHADGKGYRGGTVQASGASNSAGGESGEAFCGDSGQPTTGNGGNGAGGAGSSNGSTGGDGYCGGGGSGSTPGNGSESQGGAGGGGGEHYGAGGGGGYGTGGTGGFNGEDGGSGTSGDGVASYGAGGGGSYGDADLTRLMMGSGGGKGGRHLSYGGYGGNGGDGAGVIFIAADTIVVNGTLSSDGNSGSNQTADRGGGGGAGAGGSIKLSANTINLGTPTGSGDYKTTAAGGSGGSGYTGSYIGGAGGVGRIAIATSLGSQGSSSPASQSAQTPNYNYSVFVSDELPTPDATYYGDASWNIDKNLYGNVQIQTRSGDSNNSTDNTWESWKPITATTNTVSLQDADTHTDWISSSGSLTVGEGDVTRDVNYFEDEDELTVGDTTKLTIASATNLYAETIIDSTDLTDYDYITMWVRANTTGNVVKLGFGETSSNEHEQLFSIDNANEWQKVYWDISKIADHERDGVRNLRITATGSSYTLYFDNITADTYMSNPSATNIESTPNEYIQYRVILTTADAGYRPSMYSFEYTWENGYKIEQTDTNTLRLYNYTGETQNLRLEAIVFGADLAEWYTVDNQNIEPGDMVGLTGKMDDYGVPILGKTDELNDSDLVGVISTKAGKELGIEAENRRLLALAGRVPVKMQSNSEPIKAGDSITSGPSKGLAKKAEVGERAIGRALEDWNPETGGDKLMILVAPGYTHGTEIIASKVGDIEEKVSNISTLLGLEGTEGSTDSILGGLTETANQMAETFSSFQTYVEGMGLEVTENSIGEALLAVNSDFAVTGATSLSDTTITGNFNVGQIQVDPLQNSIDVLGAACVNGDLDNHNEVLCDAQTLYIQKGLSGNIDLLDGAVLIEADGTINVRVVEIEELRIKEGGTAGQEILPAGTIVIFVESSYVEETSLIFVTPTTDTQGANLYLGNQVPNSGFEVKSSQSINDDIEFNWLIVNQD